MFSNFYLNFAGDVAINSSTNLNKQRYHQLNIQQIQHRIKLITTPFKLCWGQPDLPLIINVLYYSKLFLNHYYFSNFIFKNQLWSYYQLTSFKCKPPFQADFHCRGYLAQIWFVINVPKQVTKPKGYVATLITLILIIRSWT